MIPFLDITLRNFMSWGDYDTTIPLAEMQQCFIAGHNGAGKSSLTQAILWCLSGKTMYNPNPGNKVMNWFTSGDCRVRIRFKNGGMLERTRTRNNEVHLLYQRAGKDIINSTLSTTTNQQAVLNKELNFDYNLFCYSVFLSQYRRAWLEVGDQQRKQMIEKIMGIDRVTVYGEVAKTKCDKIEREQTRIREWIAATESTINTLNEQLTNTKQLYSQFELTRAIRHQQKLQESENLAKQAAEVVLIDVQALQNKWEVIAKVEEKLMAIRNSIADANDKIRAAEANRDNIERACDKEVSEAHERLQNKVKARRTQLQSERKGNEKKRDGELSVANTKLSAKQRELAKKKGELDDKKDRIAHWEAKSGQICPECEQVVTADNVTGKIEPILEAKAAIEGEIITIRIEIGELETVISRIKTSYTLADNKLESSCEADINQYYAEHNQFKAQKQIEKDRAVSDAATEIRKLTATKQANENTLKQADARLAASKPTTTVSEALAHNKEQQRLMTDSQKAINDAQAILTEQNPHNNVIAGLESAIKAKTTEIEAAKKELANYDTIYSHYHYVYKAYSDRKRVKSHLISRHGPRFNQRLSGYLESFGLDIKLSLTDSLGISSNMWGYDFESGGERGRTDLAFTLAAFDLHEGVYGQQSNILILDEPERSLDDFGKQALIELIKNQLSMRFESIFIMSHSKEFMDVFPHQIVVERDERQSSITSIR